ncbi:MAG: glycosyltransferase family 2 protein [Spirochaetaceae bacterium]|nr:glycosyltransferase family 2 protein [Spirochaetaceae bacterium]
MNKSLESKNDPQVTVIIVTYQSKDTIKETLDALTEANESGFADVIVIDNASNDGTTNFISENYPWVTLLINEKNIGFGRGCNIGLDNTKTPYSLLLNPDAVIDKKSLTVMYNFMKKNPETGICGPAVIEASGELQRAGSLSNPWKIMLKPVLPNWSSKGQRIVKPGEKPMETDWICGSVMFLRMSMIKEINAFDPQIFLYFEETDLIYRASKKGWKIWTVGEAVCQHVNAASAKLTKAPMMEGTISEHYYRSRFYYLIKHFGYPLAITAEAGELVMMLVRFLINTLRGKSYKKISNRFRSPFFKLPVFPD